MNEMLIAHPLRGSEITTLTGSWSPELWEIFCRTLIGSILDTISPGQILKGGHPRFVPDGGIDAEITLDEGVQETGGLLGPGRTIFQFKWRNPTRQRTEVMRELRREATGANGKSGELEKVEQHSAGLPSRYVYLCNLALRERDIESLRTDLQRPIPHYNKSRILVLGTEQISPLVNLRPNLLHLFFLPERRFISWTEALEEHRRVEGIEAIRPMLGRDVEADRVRAFVGPPNHDSEEPLFVFGPPGIGKTRLVLESLESESSRVVWCSTPEYISPAVLRSLGGVGNPGKSRPIVVVVDDVAASEILRLFEWSKAQAGLRIVITTRANVESMLTLSDNKPIFLEPLSDVWIEKILKDLSPQMELVQGIQCVKKSSGVPGQALLCAQQHARRGKGGDIEITAPNHYGELGDLKPELRRALEVLSLLTSVDLSPGLGSDIEVLGKVFGREELRRESEELLGAGRVLARGHFLEVIPRSMASDLAMELARHKHGEVMQLFLELNRASSRLRLVERLRDFKELWANAWSSPSGWCPDIDTLKVNSRFLREIVHAAPEDAGRKLAQLLAALSREELLDFHGEVRRDVVWMIDHLAFREEAFRYAARIALLLADAENEKWANNATGLFFEMFNVLQPQIQTDPISRLGVLKELLQTSANSNQRSLILRAAARAADGTHFMVRQDVEPVFSRTPELWSWDSFQQFGVGVIELLLAIANGSDPGEKREATHELIRGMYRLAAILNIPESSLTALEQVAKFPDLTLDDKADLRTACELLIERFEKVAKELKEGPNGPNTRIVKRAEELLQRLRTEPSGHWDRIKYWIGPVSRSERLEELSGETKSQKTHAQVRIEELAMNTLQNEDTASIARGLKDLSEGIPVELWEVRYRLRLFVQALGRGDSDGKIFDAISMFSGTAAGSDLLAVYLLAAKESGAAWVNSRIDDLSKSLDLHLIFEALKYDLWSIPTEQSIARVIRIAHEGKIPRFNIAQLTSLSSWAKVLEDETFYKLITALDDTSTEVSTVLLELLLRRKDSSVPLSGDSVSFAWKLLERLADLDGRDYWEWMWDKLAASLAEEEPERGLSVLLKNSVESRFSPLNPPANLWAVLSRWDRAQLVQRVLAEIIHVEAGKGYLMAQRISDSLDPQQDAKEILVVARDAAPEQRPRIVWSLDAAREGFWELALSMVEEFQSEDLEAELFSRVATTGVVEGSVSVVYKDRSLKAREYASLASNGPRARMWARMVSARLQEMAGNEKLHDYDLEMDELRHYAAGVDPALRHWAIRRMLLHLPPERVTRELTRKQIEEALPNIDLPTRERAIWEAAVERWKEPA